MVGTDSLSNTLKSLDIVITLVAGPHYVVQDHLMYKNLLILNLRSSRLSVSVLVFCSLPTVINTDNPGHIPERQQKIPLGRGHKQKGARLSSQTTSRHFSQCSCVRPYVKYCFCRNYPGTYPASYIQVKNGHSNGK